MGRSWATQWRVEFLGREWNFVDIGSVVLVLGLHCLTLLAPFHFNWPAFWAAVALYFVTGVSRGGLEGVQVVPLHRYDNWFCLPIVLFYHFREVHLNGHIGWIFDYRSQFESYDARLKNVGDLKREPFYIFLHYMYPLFV
ncbi:hypothetical protein L3X38_019525 [Prunus dulcis]|uniref:Uncharacterized protein n=1 Tax=Prunus dulcis TaxID=3755 RepID=A0AAD4ZC45_PRUDU|nr:hypothetical protein L3X38_019525 [Prunus dulcis]